MIVCICNNVSERAIFQAVEKGMQSMPELRNNLGVGTCCGKCHSCAKQVLRECMNNMINMHPHQVPQTVLFQPQMLAA
jgi:bacterioferritin-associated ferredoxin